MARFVYNYYDMKQLQQSLQQGRDECEDAVKKTEDNKEELKKTLQDLKQQIKQEEANIAKAEADIAQAEADIASAESALASAQQALADAQAAYAKAMAEFSAAAASAEEGSNPTPPPAPDFSGLEAAISAASEALSAAQASLAKAQQDLADAQTRKADLETMQAQTEQAYTETKQVIKQLKECVADYEEAIIAVTNSMEQTWTAQGVAKSTLVELSFASVIARKYHAGTDIGRAIVENAHKNENGENVGVKEDFTWATITRADGTSKVINLESKTYKGTRKEVENGQFTKNGLKSLADVLTKRELIGLCAKGGVDPNFYKEVFDGTDYALSEQEDFLWTKAWGSGDSEGREAAKSWANYNTSLYGCVSIETPYVAFDKSSVYFCQTAFFGYDGKQACLATAFATMVSLTLNEVITPPEVTTTTDGTLKRKTDRYKDSSGQEYVVRDTGKGAGDWSNQQEMFDLVADALKDGRPAVIYLKEHAVTITGVAPGADVNNITSMKDLVCVDPWYNGGNDCNKGAGTNTGGAFGTSNDDPNWSGEVNLYALAKAKKDEVYGYTVTRVITLDPVN